MARILVVDDSEKIRRLTHTILDERGHDVITACDAYAAVDLLEKFQFDLMILDVNMPYKDGFSTLRSLRDNRRYQFLPVLVMTARNSKRDIEIAASLDAIGYVLKPLTPIHFIEKVEAVIKTVKPRSRDVYLPTTNDLGKARVTATVNGKIIRVSDLVVEIFTQQKFQPGQDVRFNSPLFSYLGVELSSLEVLSIYPEENGYKVKLKYHGLDQESLVKLRTWSESEEPLKRKRAAV